MSAKFVRRASYEERVEQDQRLTGKHIRTLLHLQDLHSENDLLKARIAELELHQTKAARCDLLEREVEKLRVSLANNITEFPQTDANSSVVHQTRSD